MLFHVDPLNDSPLMLKYKLIKNKEIKINKYT